jgi:hypothetical protein
MLKWLYQCFGYISLVNKESIIENPTIEEKNKINNNLRRKICQTCYQKRALYFREPDTMPTHCRVCKVDGMKIFILGR